MSPRRTWSGRSGSLLDYNTGDINVAGQYTVMHSCDMNKIMHGFHTFNIFSNGKTFLPDTQIHSKSSFPRQDEPQKLVWSGWLTCINGSPEYLNSLPKDFTCLPLFCYKGAENLSSLVKSWFQRTFDCCFGPLEINHTSLQWLVALWTNCHSEANIRHLKMLWTVQSVPPLQVTYTVDGQDAWELWSSVRRGSRGSGDAAEEAGWVDVREVTSFMQAIRSHFYRHFKLDLSAGVLHQVSTALGSAKFSGRIKVTSHLFTFSQLQQLDKETSSFYDHLVRIRSKDLEYYYYLFTVFFLISDLQQQICDHHPDSADRMCPPKNAHLTTPTWGLFRK